MKKRIGILFLLGLMQSIACAAPLDATGLWKTIDDVTGKPKSVIKIAEAPDHRLQGTVIKIYPRPGYDQNELCVECKGELHNQRIVGMTVLNGLKADRETAGRWSDGEILDPHNGKTYRCTVQVSDEGKKMNVRGYIGISMFGRSQVWERVDKV